MKERLPQILFIAAIASIAFAYGFLSGWAQIFPYQIFREAHIAITALTDLAQSEDIEYENLAFWEESEIDEPHYAGLAPTAGKEPIFFLGNDLTYVDIATKQALLAWIADRDGNILHAWKHPGEIWSPSRGREAVGNTWRSYTIGAHLFANGDILVSYQGTNVFPISMGLAKFDRNSNLLWQKDGFYHHWFSVDSAGNIYVPGTKVGTSPLQLEDRDKTILCADDRFPYDTIVVLDSSGNPKKEIDLLEAITKSDLAGVLNNTGTAPGNIQTCDPLHLNDIRVLPEEAASEYSGFEAGDLLLSFRSLNSLAVIDPETEQFKWYYTGATQHQHSPRFYRDNKILVFDNLGGAKSRDLSRVLSIDAGTGRAYVLFPQDDSFIPERKFFSRTAGHLDIDTSGTRVLAAFSESGVVWEIDATTGDVLWEQVNTHEVGEKPGRVVVYVATYVNSVEFPLNHGKLD